VLVNIKFYFNKTLNSSKKRGNFSLHLKLVFTSFDTNRKFKSPAQNSWTRIERSDPFN
jgi:hypothetical protein